MSSAKPFEGQMISLCWKDETRRTEEKETPGDQRNESEEK